MKISGYSNQGLDPEDVVHLDLAEITLNATPGEVRKIAAFLLAAADGMEAMGDSYGHVHLSDVQSGFDDSPHFTVFNSEASSGA